mmetsp:Transcript_76877/g.238120  ORF Transcript_76877/g.238120 Transcript_76877/m.238120 type:complete len:379 (+) Transcript_76877:32-1168(+)
MQAHKRARCTAPQASGVRNSFSMHASTQAGAVHSPSSLRREEFLARAELLGAEPRADHRAADRRAADGAGGEALAAVVHQHREGQGPAVHRAAVPPVLVGRGVVLAGERAPLGLLGLAPRVEAAPRGLELGVDGQVAALFGAGRHALHVAGVALVVAAGLGQEARGGQAPLGDGVGVGLARADAPHGGLAVQHGVLGAGLLDPDGLPAPVGHPEALRAVAGPGLHDPGGAALGAGGAEHPLVLRHGRALLQAHAVVVGVAVRAPAPLRLAALVHRAHVGCVFDGMGRGIARRRRGELPGAAVLRLPRKEAHGRAAAQQAAALDSPQVVGARALQLLGLHGLASIPWRGRVPGVPRAPGQASVRGQQRDAHQQRHGARH